MKILAVVGSSRGEEQSGVYKLVETVAKATRLDYELLHLKGKKIGGCIACLGCVEDNVCKVKDDLFELREKIVEADAYIIGGANYFSALNGLTSCFLERWYQFRHRENDTLWGKLAVAVGVAGRDGAKPADAINTYMMYNLVETVATVTGQHAPSCFVCGYGEDCKVGAIHGMYGPGFKITEESTPSVAKQPETMKAAREAGEELARRLTGGYDRAEVAQRVQKKIMQRFNEAS